MSCTRKRSLTQIYSLAHPDVMLEEAGQKSGKWSAEEEMYANKLIAQFEAGTLTDCAEGSTLRSYLARKLNCAPMRISKKFAGQCIGKHTFTKKEPCVTPATDRDSISEATTLTSSPVLNDDPLDFMWDNAIDIMSFDSFTDLQCRQDTYTSSSNAVAAFPVPVEMESTGAGMKMWPNTVPQSDFYPPQKRQFVSAVESDDVGLDLDNMYSNCNAANVIPSSEHASLAPAPVVPVSELPMKKDWGLRCTIPQYQYMPPSPSMMVPSGAAVVTPNACGEEVAVSAFVPCPPQQQYKQFDVRPQYEQCQKYEQCQQYDACTQYAACKQQDACTQTNYVDLGQLEAAEWRDVLDYFCGPQTQCC